MTLEQIRQRRLAIDGAPWKYASVPDQRVYGTSPGGCNLMISDYPVCDVRGWGHLQYRGSSRGGPEAQALQDANGMFIANAPTDIDLLLAEVDRLRLLLKKVQDHCAGDAHPRWGRDPATTNSRGYLLDICNAALD